MTAARTGKLGPGEGVARPGGRRQRQGTARADGPDVGGGRGACGGRRGPARRRGPISAPRCPPGSRPCSSPCARAAPTSSAILLKAGADVNEAMQPKRTAGKAPAPGDQPADPGRRERPLRAGRRPAGGGRRPERPAIGLHGAPHDLTWVRKPNRGDDDDGDPAPIGSGNLTSLELVEKLVKHGADVNARLKRGASGRGVLSRAGATPFLLAAVTADVPLHEDARQARRRPAAAERRRTARR